MVPWPTPPRAQCHDHSYDPCTEARKVIPCAEATMAESRTFLTRSWRTKEAGALGTSARRPCLGLVCDAAGSGAHCLGVKLGFYCPAVPQPSRGQGRKEGSCVFTPALKRLHNKETGVPASQSYWQRLPLRGRVWKGEGVAFPEFTE